MTVKLVDGVAVIVCANRIIAITVDVEHFVQIQTVSLLILIFQYLIQEHAIVVQLIAVAQQATIAMLGQVHAQQHQFLNVLQQME